MFIPADAVAHVAAIGETDGQETVNDLYFKSTAGPITSVNLAALASAIDEWYANDVGGTFFSDTWTYSHTRARDLTSQNSFVAIASAALVPGGIAGEQAPSNVSSNMVFGTGLAGRSLHGSNRIPAIPNSVVTTNTIDTDWLTGLLGAYDGLLAPSSILPGGWTWVMVSFFSGTTFNEQGKKVPIPRTAGVIHEIFDVYFPDTIVDSQKTRLPKHGR